MGRPPCCDKIGIKKGPWTPEEDIILVSYIQEHGPGNWRSVPTNTGLMRCSKSCRLRWTNYLRPGIKRGNFTPHEEGMIIHLQALLGNKWASIASYLPQRTDNDIKNYWNTHLKKKLNKSESSDQDKSISENIALQTQTSAARNTMNHRSTYASSTENISRLLEGWMRASPKTSFLENRNNNLIDHNQFPIYEQQLQGSWEDHHQGHDIKRINVNHHDHEGGFNVCPKINNRDEEVDDEEDDHNNNATNPPLTFIEKWLLEETSSSNGGGGGQMEEMSQLVELSNML